MNPSMLIPAAEPILVGAGWFKLFLLAFFMVHILLMNIMVGTGFIALVTGLKGREENLPIQKDISKKLPVIFALAINFGVAPLLFLQVLYGRFIYVGFQLSAVYWLSIIAVLIIAYYCVYGYKFHFETLGIRRTWLMGTAVAFLLMIGFVFSSSMTLMLNVKGWAAYAGSPGGMLLNLSDPTLFPRYLHFMTASVAVGGLFTAIVWTLKKAPSSLQAARNIDQGMKWFSYATLAQIFIGFWFQMSLPTEIMSLFLGHSLGHTMVFAVGMGLAIQTLYWGLKTRVWPSVFSLILLVLVMIIMRDMVRTAYLNPYAGNFDLPGYSHTNLLMAFACCLTGVLGVIVYVMNLWRKTENIQNI
jgi:hypothetical protein